MTVFMNRKGKIMRKILENNWQNILVVIVAGWVLVYAYNDVDPCCSWRMNQAKAHSFFMAVGLWGIRFLLLSLLITPLYAFTGWRFLPKFRKPLGLATFGFVSIHVYIHLTAKAGFEAYNIVERLTEPYFIIFGAIAYVILLAMAITSFKPTMKMMGRFWKPLHRLVYGAGVLIIAHVLIAATTGKRAFAGGEAMLPEYQFYLGVLIALLVVRIPMIKRGLQAVSPFKPKRKKVKRVLAT